MCKFVLPKFSIGSLDLSVSSFTNGNLPVTISYKTTPYEYKSDFLV